ncbi:phosphoribosyltransferase-like protein [Staphylotrichum tortipilum]|uniref:adenine phosphoribosyltransferase n=1 Tax=Staphylotrichum tortipilum TaxID=2831512 RepID=A0AAN6MVQ0_9PEZI|nr:phosphoribosyltransferase-like protein [Staphylotrichum longicolle]KAK3907078.1 phosphoribosyltransferase-like protein [Staphylotrichum longicolle]
MTTPVDPAPLPSVEAAAALASTTANDHPDHHSSSAPAASSSDASRGQSAAAAAGASELARTKIALLGALKHFADFPIPGIKFIDILPLFQDPVIHTALLRALELQVLEFGEDAKPDVVVGLDARGFLFGPSLALRLDASFVPVRKKGKMPGPCVTAAYEKEYGTDFFQMQEGAVKPGQKVLVVDDIIATGGSAAAAGALVKQLGGNLIGYMFILEIPVLNGRSKLGGTKTVTLLETNE